MFSIFRRSGAQPTAPAEPPKVDPALLQHCEELKSRVDKATPVIKENLKGISDAGIDTSRDISADWSKGKVAAVVPDVVAKKVVNPAIDRVTTRVADAAKVQAHRVADVSVDMSAGLSKQAIDKLFR